MATEIVADQSQAAPCAKSRSWRFEKKTRGPWLGSLEPQRDRYHAALNAPTCRNRGPSGRLLGGGGWVTRFWIVRPLLKLEAGQVMPDGLVIPPTGAFLHDQPVGGPLYSVRQAKKHLARTIRRYPDARLMKTTMDARDGTRPPGSISAPDAPAGWWNVRVAKPALEGQPTVPRLSWAQLQAAQFPSRDEPGVHHG